MAAPTLYRSSDASAPVLTGTAGDLVNLLDKCLVSGYGSKSAAGWTRKTGFAGNSSTRAVFQMPAGTAFYLDVDDRGASGGLTGASGKEAAVRAYESMTDVSTGTNPFPTTAQIAAATANWRKSATADAVPRGWVLIADDRSFILGILDGDSGAVYKVYSFGDIYSLKSGDSYRTHLLTRSAVNGAGAAWGGGSLGTNVGAGGYSGFYMPRLAAGTGTSVNPVVMIFGSSFETAGTYGSQYTLDSVGNIFISRFVVIDNAVAIRGWIRGLYMIHTPIGLNDGDTFSGSGDFAGRTFVVLKNVSASSALALETTAWDT